MAVLELELPLGDSEQTAAAVAKLASALEVLGAGRVRMRLVLEQVEAGAQEEPAETAPAPAPAPADPRAEEVAKLVGELVELAGSRKAAALAAGVSTASLRKWLNGQQSPSATKLKALRRAVARARGLGKVSAA